MEFVEKEFKGIGGYLDYVFSEIFEISKLLMIICMIWLRIFM